MAEEALREFTLVGGTALALQMGHRFSEDIDMFCFGDFESFALQKLLNERLSPSFNITRNYFIQFTVDGIKVDLMKYPYPPVYPIVVEDGIRMLSVRDIIPMKLSAISNRGAKKDFFDIYFLLREFRFDEMLMLYSERFNMPEVISVLRSIQYFDDAELENDPLCFEKVTWAQVKNAIQQQVRAYLR